MERMKVMMSGLPGRMASLAAQHITASTDFELLPFGLTGPEIECGQVEISQSRVELFRPHERHIVVPRIRQAGRCFALDFTAPDAGGANTEFFTQQDIPFVMGTTGIDYKAAEKVISNSQISAVVSPNFAAPIVVLQAMFEWAAKTYPGTLAGFELVVTESHQSMKKDTSGTAKVIVNALNILGIDFPIENIVKLRDREAQLHWGVPQKALDGHGFHTYWLNSQDGDVRIELIHNIMGRDVYARGALTALSFLVRKMAEGIRGKMFSMEDVLAEF